MGRNLSRIYILICKTKNSNKKTKPINFTKRQTIISTTSIRSNNKNQSTEYKFKTKKKKKKKKKKRENTKKRRKKQKLFLHEKHVSHTSEHPVNRKQSSKNLFISVRDQIETNRVGTESNSENLPWEEKFP